MINFLAFQVCRGRCLCLHGQWRQTRVHPDKRCSCVASGGRSCQSFRYQVLAGNCEEDLLLTPSPKFFGGPHDASTSFATIVVVEGNFLYGLQFGFQIVRLVEWWVRRCPILIIRNDNYLGNVLIISKKGPLAMRTNPALTIPWMVDLSSLVFASQWHSILCCGCFGCRWWWWGFAANWSNKTVEIGATGDNNGDKNIARVQWEWGLPRCCSSTLDL